MALMILKTCMKRVALLGCTILLIVALLIGCSKATRNPSRVGSQSYLSQALYPHPSGWALPEQHGLTFQNGGFINTGACAKSCHGDHLNGGSGPSCTKCHANWPHTENWRNKEQHGQYIKTKGTSNCATKCHGEDLAGGLSRVACTSCHNVYPHAKNFSEAGQHGPLALGQGKDACKGCHGSELRGGDTTPSCFTCHKDNYPHASGWADKSKHGDWVLKAGKETCATACHGKDLAGGISGVGCSSCHSIYPHSVDFSNPEKHGPMALTGKTTTCALCHEVQSGKSGTQTVPACSSCHAGVFPHAADWATKVNHGTFVIKNGKSACATRCHGEDLKGGDVQKSCDSCHILWPTEHRKTEWKAAPHGKKFRELGKSACNSCHIESPAPGALAKACSSCHVSLPKHDEIAWKTQGHGSFVTQSGTNECKSCHGKVLEEFCSKCHASYPTKHTPDWKQKAGGHDLYVKGTLKGDGSECKLCHGQDLKGGDVVKTGCNTCHAPGKTPHQPGKQSTVCQEDPEDEMSPMVPCIVDIPFYSTHGKDAKKSSTLCTLCHGVDYKGGFSGKSCFTCHDYGNYYPHTSPGWGKTGGHGATYLSKNAHCASACHGSDLIGGLSGVACNKCHAAFPHSQSGDWLEHGKVLMEGTGTIEAKYVAKCGSCHGAIEKLSNGPSSLGYFTPLKIYRCGVCHRSYPHIGFKGVTFKLVDLTWKPSGHASYTYYSSVVSTIEDSATGCGGVSALGCHDNPARKGPPKPGLGMGICNAFCHK
ncbi:hypothetical protein WDW86_16115 [Bdellovibrionota bacterium FG-2]